MGAKKNNADELFSMLQSLKDVINNMSVKNIETEIFLANLPDGKFSDPKVVLDACIVEGLIIMEKDILTPCNEIHEKRVAAIWAKGDKEEGVKPVEEVMDKPTIFDGPGEYYQMMVTAVGMVVIREETIPTEWKATKSGQRYFKHFWMIQKEPPLRKVHKTDDGHEQIIEVPRVRFYKVDRGAYVHLENMLFSMQLERTDLLIQNIMRMPEAVLRTGE